MSIRASVCVGGEKSGVCGGREEWCVWAVM